MSKSTKVFLAIIAAVAVLGVAVFYRGGGLQGKLQIKTTIGKLQVVVDSSTPPEGIVVAGTVDKLVSVFKATASGDEGFEIKKLTVINRYDNVKGDVDNNIKTVRLTYKDSSNVTVSKEGVLVNGTVSFSGLNVIVPKNDNAKINVSADFKTIFGGATSGEKVALSIEGFDARGLQTGGVLSGHVVNGLNLVKKFTVAPEEGGGTLVLSKDNSSPSGGIALGSSDVILATFTVQAQGEDIELQKIALDFSNGAPKTGAQDTTGYFDCGTGSMTTGCDLTGTIKVQTESGKILYSVAANTAKIWDNYNKAVYATLSVYHTVKAGASEKIQIIGSIASDATYTGLGENLIVGINRIYYYKKGSLKYGDTGVAVGNSLSVTTVNTSGTLTITLADDNPVTKILVAGTQYTAADADVAKFKFTANKAEDIYLNKLTIRTDTDADDSAISGAALYGSTDGTQLGTLIGTVHAMQSDGTRAGYISWDWAGASRPKVLSNSSYFITVKANVVSSGQLATVSGLTPVIQLADVEAEGASAISPKNNALDQMPTGLVLGTFTAPTTATDLAAELSATASTITIGNTSTAPADATANGMLDNDQGYYCYVDVNAAGGYPLDGGREIFYVQGEDSPAGTSGVYQIERGIFNTTSETITPTSDNENLYCVAAPKGNIIQVLNTKLSASTDTIGLDSSGKTEMKLAKIKFTAKANTADTAENKATINKVRVSVFATNADASNFVMYPDEKYNDSGYQVVGKYVADSVVEFNFADANADGLADTTFSSTVYDDIVEGQSRIYTIKADTVFGTNGSLYVELAKTGSGVTSFPGAGSMVYTAIYGSNTDVSWSDWAATPTTSLWLNQTGTNVALRYFVSPSSTGTPDMTAPVLSTVSSDNYGTIAGTVQAGDVLSFTFSEVMSHVTFTDVKMVVPGVITADFAPQSVNDGVLFVFATAGSATVASFTPIWNSATKLSLTTGVVGGFVVGDPSGATTPSSTLFMDVYGNAGVTGTPTLASNSW